MSQLIKISYRYFAGIRLKRSKKSERNCLSKLSYHSPKISY